MRVLYCGLLGLANAIVYTVKLFVQSAGPSQFPTGFVNTDSVHTYSHLTHHVSFVFRHAAHQSVLSLFCFYSYRLHAANSRVSNHHTPPLNIFGGSPPSLLHSPSLTNLPFLIIISLYPLKIQQPRSCNLLLHLKGIVTQIPTTKDLCDTGANDTEIMHSQVSLLQQNG